MPFGRILLVPPSAEELGILMNGVVFNESDTINEDIVMANSRLLWDNYLRTSVVTSATDSANVINLYDQIITQTWNITGTNATLNITFPNPRAVDCIGLLALTQGTGSAGVSVYHTSVDNANRLVTFSGDLTKPRMVTFDETTASIFIVTFNVQSPIRIGQLALSKATLFPSSPTIGMELGKFNNADDERTTITEGTAFARSTLSTNIRPSVFPFEAIPITWIRDNWIPFSDGHKGGWFGSFGIQYCNQMIQSLVIGHLIT